MKITLSLEEDGQENHSVEIETEPTQILHSIADKVAKDFDTDVEDILQCLAESRGTIRAIHQSQNFLVMNAAHAACDWSASHCISKVSRRRAGFMLLALGARFIDGDARDLA